MGIQDVNLLNEIIDTLVYIIPFYENIGELKKLLLLSEREMQTLCLLLKGYTAKHIALHLQISHRTIEIYIIRIKEKLCLPCKLEVID